MARDRDELDPTRITNQPALTTSSGRIWFIVGGIFAGISIVVLLLLLSREPQGVALFGVLAIAALYGVMLYVGSQVEPGRIRLGVLAITMLVMAVIALTCVIVIAFAESNAAVG